jgi:large subunit ribosomal protein L23
MSANIDFHQVIKKPLVSEKSTWGMNEQKRYAFEVDPRASKDEIKDAVQKIYKVRVVGVNTVVNKHKKRRIKTGIVQDAATKKAIVRLHADDQIDLF